jgi:hypothetical protein
MGRAPGLTVCFGKEGASPNRKDPYSIHLTASCESSSWSPSSVSEPSSYISRRASVRSRTSSQHQDSRRSARVAESLSRYNRWVLASISMSSKQIASLNPRKRFPGPQQPISEPGKSEYCLRQKVILPGSRREGQSFFIGHDLLSSATGRAGNALAPLRG